jgi:hypothetical protein
MKNSIRFPIQFKVLNRKLCVLLSVLLSLIGPCRVSIADLTISSGEFIDNTGQHHPWHVNAAHTLIWGGQPWIPAGGIFQSRYLTGPHTDANFAADQGDLQKLKQHGIHAIILVTTEDLVPISDLPTANLQRFLNYLDQQGFQYGLTVSSFPRDPVEATVVNPGIYRVSSPQPGSVYTFGNLPGLIGGTYYLVSAADGSVIATGDANVIDAQTASVTLKSSQGGPGTVLLLYPKRLFLPTSLEGTHLPDIWARADAYRDSLLLYFGGIKFGTGMRFFLDPIVDAVGYYGDEDAGAIPDSSAYQFAFNAWLQDHYDKSLAKLNSSWGVRNQDVFDFAAAARSIPLWYQSRGVQLLVDPASHKSFQVIAASSQYWEDVRQFRIDSLQNVMAQLAFSLKNGIADVPVVYRWTRPSKLYVGKGSDQGYDGLLVSTSEHGKTLASNAAGWALADAEESSASTWLIGELTANPIAGGRGYPSSAALATDSSVLRSLAVKGYFIDNFLRLPESDWTETSLLDAPEEQLDWIHSDDLSTQKQASTISTFVPNILFYPINLKLASVGVRQFDDGTWWLPSYRDGESVDIGPGLDCYTLTQPSGGTSLVLWSPDGSATSASFNLPKKTSVSATSPDNTLVTISLTKGVYTIPTSKSPILVHGVSTLPLISNATTLLMVEAEKLISTAVAQQIPMDVDDQRLYYIKNEVLDTNDEEHQKIAYPLLVSLNNDLRAQLDPNAWVEGESASQQTFGTVVASPSASGGAFLWEDTDHAPSGSNPYEATYTLNVGAPGDYTVWASLAPGPPGSGSSSPLSYSIDNGIEYDVSQPQPSGEPYGSVLDAATVTHAGSFCWYQLGTITLTPGTHSLNFFLTGPATATNRYTLGIDAICLSRGTFVPNGPERPTIN